MSIEQNNDLCHALVQKDILRSNQSHRAVDCQFIVSHRLIHFFNDQKAFPDPQFSIIK